jgi:RND family efflux transporter MFP subunit
VKYLGLVSVGLIALALSGCQNGATSVTTAAAAPGPSKPAAGEPISAAPVEEAFSASGPIVVENQVDLAAQREGVIAELLADTGRQVRKGDLLAKLDDRQIQADRDAARDQLASIEADLKNWQATVKMAEIDLERSEKMFESKLITQSQVEHDRFKLTATRFEYDREQKNVERAKNVLKSLDFELEKTRITAPFTGVIARRYVREGQRVATGDKVFWVTATGPMTVRFNVPEKFAAEIRRSTPLEITPAELPEKKYPGRVLMASPVIDPASGTFDVSAEFTGPTGDLKPGMMTNIRLKTAR